MTTGVPVGVLITLGVALVVLAAMLVAAETAFERVSRAEAARMVADGQRGSKQLASMLDNLARSLNVTIFVRNAAEAMAATCIALVVDSIVDSWWVVLLTSMTVMGVVFFVLIGVTPRTLGREHPEKVARLAAPVVNGITVFFGPIAGLLVAIGNAVTPGKGFTQGPFASEAELRDLVDVASEASQIDVGERRMIHSVFELGDTIVREVMVPRTDVVFLDAEETLLESVRIFLASGYSRIPVIGEDVDDPVGVLYLKDVTQSLYGRSSAAGAEAADREVGVQPVTAVMRDVTWVPESKTVDSLLHQMQRDHFHLALVADEYGGTAGLVTIEDLVEEIVGEIADEHDRERPGVEPLEDGTYRFDARVAIDELEELFDVEIEDSSVDSVGGLLSKELGRVPIPGSSADVGSLRLTAERVQGRRKRLATVLVQRVNGGENHDEGDRR